MEYKEKQYSIEAGLAKGRPLPEWYLNKPDIFPGDYFYLRAFYDLNTCRQVGMGLGPIPWNVVIQYAGISELEQELIEPFIHIIRMMDNAYLDYHEKKQTREQNRNK